MQISLDGTLNLTQRILRTLKELLRLSSYGYVSAWLRQFKQMGLQLKKDWLEKSTLVLVFSWYLAWIISGES